MNNRSLKYFTKTKARKVLECPTDLKSFLMAEFNLTCNSFVKKDIMRVMEQLEQPISNRKIAQA